MNSSNKVLQTEHLTKRFGQLSAVDDVSLAIPQGEIHAIIGPNGAGKTTLLDLITKRTVPTAGKTYFNNQEITQLPPEKIVNLGMCKCFQISKLFSNLTVFENIQIARINKTGKAFNLLPMKKGFLEDDVIRFLSYVGMTEQRHEIAGYLSYGDQRRLEIAITLAMEPSLLMLDEPTAGVARAEGYEIMQLVQKLAKDHDMTMIFIEHDMDIVFNYSDQISVMNSGRLIATGSPDEIRNNQVVQDAYLGDTHE
ncbi:MAG: ABC transporter ATP-binding protein [Treponema sp.]|jgi:branched-chain amino acid transport system ATP-binding protein|nr:ABC transporter ATP-binding protein [Treponema sp.]